MSAVINIHKKKGIRPDYDIYIGRAIYRGTEFIKDSKWCNPFQTSKVPLDMNLEFFEIYARRMLWDDLDELEGKKLGCFCINTKEITPLKCHGQVLMKLLQEKKIPIPICPQCKVKCEVTEPFRIITQMARKFDCPKCEYGGLQITGVYHE